MDDRLTMLMAPLTGYRLLDGGTLEEGSIIGFRKGGDECLYVPRTEEEKGMEWIPVGSFSVDPEAVTPPDMLPDPAAETPPGEEAHQEGEPSAPDQGRGPFGRSVRRRPELE